MPFYDSGLMGYVNAETVE